MDTQHSDFASNQGAPPVDHESYAEALTGRAREPQEPEVDLDATSGALDPEKGPEKPRTRDERVNVARLVREKIKTYRIGGDPFTSNQICNDLHLPVHHGSVSSTLTKLAAAGHLGAEKVSKPAGEGRPYYFFTVLNKDFSAFTGRSYAPKLAPEEPAGEEPITSEGASPMDEVEAKGTKEPVADEVMLRRVSAYALQAAERFETLRKIEAEFAAERAKPKLDTATLDQCLDRIAAIRIGAPA